MEDYDDLYDQAVIDFSILLGLKPFKEDSSTSEGTIDASIQDILPQYTPSNTSTQNTSLLIQSTPLAPVQNTASLQNYSKFKGFELFNRIYDKVQAYNPDAAKYRNLLTKIASLESGFNAGIVNKIGAAGYFLFIDSTRNNIMKKMGKSTNKSYFLNNPEVLILAAILLAKEFEKSFNSEDIRLSLRKGHTMNGLISGAWLAGTGGVRKYLRYGKDSTDGGTTVSKRIKVGDSV